ECYDGLIKSNHLDKEFFSSYDVYSLKQSRKDKDKDKGPSAGSDRGFKKGNTSKDAEPTIGPKSKDSTSGSSKGTKSQPKSSKKNVQSEVPEFEVADTYMPQDQGGDLGPAFRLLKGTCSNYAELEYDFEECYKALSEKLDWDNTKGGDYPFDLTKPLPLVKVGNRQKVPTDYFFNNDLKYLQGGISTMTYTTSLTKKKAAHYDLPGIEDMVLNIWSPVKVALDRYAKWGISYWRAQCKTFYAYAQGLKSTHDVYSTKRIMAVTRVNVMKKHGYGYLREIEVRRADTVLYTFKEVDFPRLRLNDIKDMLILVAQNWLTNLLGNDVFDFAIALKMFTRSLVIQKRVRYLQLGVESYQKKSSILHHQEYPHEVPAKEKTGFFGKEKSSLHGQGNQQAAEGKKDDAELRKIYWDIPLDSVVVLRYEKGSKCDNKGRVPTEMELVLKKTQQGFSYEVSVSVEGVEELKRKVKIKGEKKEASLHLDRNRVNTSAVRITKMIADIEDRHHRPSDAMHNPP
nr:hypothetical protein [Tanacetum cinerariifolium]